MIEQARTAPPIVLYSHDTLGFGHLRRNLLLADALRDDLRRHVQARSDLSLIDCVREPIALMASAATWPAAVNQAPETQTPGSAECFTDRRCLVQYGRTNSG